MARSVQTAYLLEDHPRCGETYFTTNPVELEKVLEKIKIAHGGDSPETATPALTKIVSTYDWFKSPKIKSLWCC